MPDERKAITSGTKYEFQYGYSRAVRQGNVIRLSGTAGFEADGTLADDAGEQARRALAIVKDAIEELGGTLDDVIMTRVYVSEASNIDRVAMVHGDVFREIKPASTFVKVDFIEPRILVEIEAEAILGGQKEKV